ncbi:ubiquitin carboxyl-terminal hydrolase 48-like [Tachypleus tridentatus]|uniref:ubiquitin carboxyl-terminal hydrolase 48-like n=1 Tax=Tachypleus tridentatus TaxID=6853 RepID=UPI003FD2875C
MPSKQQLDKAAWEWAEHTEPDNITSEHIETAYRVKLKPCKPTSCRRNCKGNPRCLVGLGERNWLQDIADEDWHEIDDPNSERRPKGSFVGLKNLGATCYVNSFLQVWYHNPLFRRAIYQWKREDDPQELIPLTNTKDEAGEIECSTNGNEKQGVYSPSSCIGHLQLIFALLQFSERKYIDPTPFINCLGLSVTQQQDAQEFSQLFISLLEDKLSYQTHPFVKNIIQQLYSGEYAYITRCHKCCTESARPSRFYELCLNIKGHKDIHGSLQEFLQDEKMEGSNQYFCDQCQLKQDATRFIRLLHLPPVLNIQLLRFVFDRQTGQKKKLNSFIRFHEVLDMSAYLQKPESPVLYDLSAVLIHRGPSAYSGHYVAHICDRVSGAWFKFNDETVEKMEGKKLQLGTEENIEEEGGGKQTGKPPRLSKGHHASNNAYMLVYRARNPEQKELPPDNSCEWDLPEHLQEAVVEDNSRFEEWVMELGLMREQNVQSGKARQTEIRTLYDILPATEGGPKEWISSEWLMKWLNADVGQVDAIDNSGVLCIHNKLHPDKVTNVKYINQQAADELYEKYGGGPRLRDATCTKCVESRCHLIRIRARVQEDSKTITSLFKMKISSDEDAFWVGKDSIKDWKKMVLSQYKNWDSMSPSSGYEENNNNYDHMSSSVEKSHSDEGMSGNGTTTEEDHDDNSGYNFNEDVLCEHSNLSVKEGCRRLVQAKVWEILKQYFPNAPEFPRTASVCPECEMKQEENQVNKDRNRLLALEQKTCLQDLYSDRNQPIWSKVEPNTVVYVVDRNFVEEWQSLLIHVELAVVMTGLSYLYSREQIREIKLCKLKCYVPTVGSPSLQAIPPLPEDSDQDKMESNSLSFLPLCADMSIKPNAGLSEKSVLLTQSLNGESSPQKKLQTLSDERDLVGFELKTRIEALSCIHITGSTLGHSRSHSSMLVDLNPEGKNLDNCFSKLPSLFLLCRDPKKKPVTVVSNAELLCPHHLLLYSPEITGDIDPQSRLYLVWEYQWQVITRLFQVDTEIRVWKEIHNRSPDCPVINSTPALCDPCYVARLHDVQQQLLDFSSAKIYVRRVSKFDDIELTGSPTVDSESPDCDVAPSIIGKEEDPEFIQCVKKRKCHEGPDGTNVGGDSQLRRSSRRRKLRGEKELIVSSSQTLRDLKLQIMKLFSVAPYDQNLILDGKPLVNNQARLSRLRIYPGSLILLKADEPSEEIIIMEDYLRAAAPETGFKDGYNCRKISAKTGLELNKSHKETSPTDGKSKSYRKTTLIQNFLEPLVLKLNLQSVIHVATKISENIHYNKRTFLPKRQETEKVETSKTPKHWTACMRRREFWFHESKIDD